MPSIRADRLQSLLSELKRRRVFRVAAVYLVLAFAALQAFDIVVPALHLPDWTMTLLVVLAIAGFVAAIALAWAFDVTPEGVVRDTATTAATAAAQSATAAPTVEPPAEADGHTVAVLPFVNMSAEPDNEFFADGITEDVIAHLARIGSLRVISRTSVMPFKNHEQSIREIGARLGATSVLEGSVRRAGDRVRIVAQLIDARTDQHLWAETYDRRLTDIFFIQTDVALQIASALRAELSVDERTRIAQEPTRDMEAYQLYLKGRHWYVRYTPEAMHRAVEYYRRAIAIDPSYALAYASIAIAFSELADSGSMPSDEARKQALPAIREALRLDPSLPEALYTSARLKGLWEYDWAGAEADYRRAIELCPNCAEAYDLYGRMLTGRERYDEAIALLRRAHELDPLTVRVDLPNALLRAGRYEEAAQEAARAVEFDPDYDRAHATLGWAYLKLGRTDEGLAEIERAVELGNSYPQWLAQLGEARAQAGQTDAAREIKIPGAARADESGVGPEDGMPSADAPSSGGRDQEFDVSGTRNEDGCGRAPRRRDRRAQRQWRRRPSSDVARFAWSGILVRRRRAECLRGGTRARTGPGPARPRSSSVSPSRPLRWASRRRRAHRRRTAPS